jgi:mono/diheme cytochrome c family protein
MKGKITTAVVVALAAFTAGYSTVRAQATPHSVWDGVYTAEQAKRGQALYNQHCAHCHGDTLGGGEMAPPLAGGNFQSNWNGLSVADLFDRTRISMPQDKPGKLSREVNSDILAYVFSANQYPAGQTELPKASEVLKDIMIEASKAEKK